MLVIIKFEGLSLRLVFFLIVVILIHIRSMIKQTAVMPNFPPCSHPLFLLLCYRDRLITLTSSTVLFDQYFNYDRIIIILSFCTALISSKHIFPYVQKNLAQCKAILLSHCWSAESALTGTNVFHMCAFMCVKNVFGAAV